jgi:phage baseplate assembly protein W
MDRTTGKPLGERERIDQAIADVLSTPVGTRVTIRDYGSRVFEYLDKPMTKAWRVQVISEVAKAIRSWVPEFRVKSVEVAADSDLPTGKATFMIDGDYLFASRTEPGRVRVEVQSSPSEGRVRAFAR